MTYDYASRSVWLDSLADEPDPNRYDLCPPHADRQSVPQGWELVDRRRTTLLVPGAGFRWRADVA